MDSCVAYLSYRGIFAMQLDFGQLNLFRTATHRNFLFLLTQWPGFYFDSPRPEYAGTYEQSHSDSIVSLLICEHFPPISWILKKLMLMARLNSYALLAFTLLWFCLHLMQIVWPGLYSAEWIGLSISLSTELERWTWHSINYGKSGSRECSKF